VNHTNVVENCISQAIDGTLKNYDELIHYLHQFSWKANDAYICAIMPLEERDATTYTAVNSCLNLKQLFPNSFVFTKDNNIVLLLNLSLSQIDASEVPRLLADFLREGLFKAGISNVKAELPSLKEAYKEANMILEMGDDIAPTKWCYQFSEHRIEYGYWEATKILHPESLIHESIQQLLQHDEQHSGQLTETLETYLKHDRNLTQTSNLLFIHRSTLQYRLEKIENMTHLDLNDPDTRYQLLYSFDLLKWYESTF
jgi:sugar diacid utilization regulator